MRISITITNWLKLYSEMIHGKMLFSRPACQVKITITTYGFNALEQRFQIHAPEHPSPQGAKYFYQHKDYNLDRSSADFVPYTNNGQLRQNTGEERSVPLLQRKHGQYVARF